MQNRGCVMPQADSPNFQSAPSITVIIPVHNGGENLRLCLQALSASIRSADEVIVVDDGSTDQSANIASSFHTQVVSLTGAPHGPAVARNRGAEIARGNLLIFLDADVLAHPDTLGLFEKYFWENPEITAIFGSYDDRPPGRGLVSRYKNLLHHYTHQHSQREASTFWAGCGGIRRKVFAQMGGFSESYLRPSIEDIELGVRLRQAAYRVWLCNDIQVTHLKNWTLKSMLISDIRDRAIPWTRLILQQGRLPTDLNLDKKNRLGAIVAWLALLSFLIGIISTPMFVGVVLFIIALVLLNRDLYIFFVRHGGFRFALVAIGPHILYLLYSSLIFALVVGLARLGLSRFRSVQLGRSRP
jgi:GT2 family glycosyltransferase